MRKLRHLAFVAVVVLVVAACGDDSSTVGTTDGAGEAGGDEAGGREDATRDESVVVQVMVDGGFVPVEVALRTVPTLTVTAAGTVITGAPILAIYPGPAIHPLQAATVDPADVESLVERARELGLLSADLDFGQPPVTDMPNTTVTIVVDGVTYQHVANALDFALDDGAFDDGNVTGDAGLSPEARANREALSEFVQAAQQLGVGDRAWVPAAIAVSVVGPHQPSDEFTDPDPVDWPLDTAPATEGDFACTVVEGDDAGVLLGALAAANERTPWLVDGEALSLAFRPVLPGQAGCS